MAEAEDALEAFQRLKRGLAKGSSATVGAQADRNQVQSVARTWFERWRSPLEQQLGSSEALRRVDADVQALHHLSLRTSQREKYRLCLNRVLRELREIATEAAVATWTRSQTGDSPGNPEVLARLEVLEPALAASYRQVLRDLGQSDRESYLGTANELREVLRAALALLAPDEQVRQTSWFKASRKSAKGDDAKRGPTHKERARFILSGAGSSEREVTEIAIEDIEARTDALVRALYTRTSAAAHVGKSRDEVQRLVQYQDAVLLELLPPA
jgi:hypothetical protein